MLTIDVNLVGSILAILVIAFSAIVAIVKMSTSITVMAKAVERLDKKVDEHEDRITKNETDILLGDQRCTMVQQAKKEVHA